MIYLYSFVSIKCVKGRNCKVYNLSPWFFKKWETAYAYREREGIDPDYNPLYFFPGKPPKQIFHDL